MSDNIPSCPVCGSEFSYFDGNVFVCPECGNEWNDSLIQEQDDNKVIDANGNILSDGDSVVVIKDLKVKGASNPIKQGTIVKNISLTNEAGHNISCKIAGFGAMNLKSEFVKKV